MREASETRSKSVTLDVAPAHLETVRAILREHAPGAEVRAFGSRVSGGARDHSDLDLLVDNGAMLSIRQWGALVEAFQNSTLPFRVDVIDRYTTSEGFQTAIAGQSVVIQPTKSHG